MKSIAWDKTVNGNNALTADFFQLSSSLCYPQTFSKEDISHR